MDTHPHTDCRDNVATFLEHRATNLDFDRAPIFYNDLTLQLDLPPVDQYWMSHPLCKVFDLLDREDVGANRPLRTALVISKERNLPGEGFFKTMALLRNHRNPAKDSIAQMKLWADEVRRLLAYYSTSVT